MREFIKDHVVKFTSGIFVFLVFVFNFSTFFFLDNEKFITLDFSLSCLVATFLSWLFGFHFSDPKDREIVYAMGVVLLLIFLTWIPSAILFPSPFGFVSSLIISTIIALPLSFGYAHRKKIFQTLKNSLSNARNYLIQKKNSLTLTQIERWIHYCKIVKYLGLIVGLVSLILTVLNAYHEEEKINKSSAITGLAGGGLLIGASEVVKDWILEPQLKRLENPLPFSRTDTVSTYATASSNITAASYRTASSS